MTRKWAYRAIRQGWPEFSQWLDAVIQRVEMYNASLPVPLSPPECRAIGKSIAKYTHRNFTPETFAQYVADTHTLTYVFVPLALKPRYAVSLPREVPFLSRRRSRIHSCSQTSGNHLLRTAMTRKASLSSQQLRMRDCWTFTIGDRSCTHRLPHVNGSAKTQPVKRRKTLPVRAVFRPKISHVTPSVGLLSIPVARAGNLLIRWLSRRRYTWHPLTGLCTVSVDNPEPVLSARTITWQEQVKFSLQDVKHLK